MFKKDSVFIVAELSANHNNNYELAVKTIESIARTGANAVKVQTYTADSLALDVDNVYFGPKKEGPWKGIRPYDLYREASMPYEWQPELKKVAESLGLIFFSSPFDIEAVDFLESFDCPIYKIASFEITDIPLIEYVASKGKPIIISTGVAELDDIELAISVCKNAGNNNITLLKCTSQYPANISDANLSTIPDMKERFRVEVGVSDHTFGDLVPVIAVALGAKVVEKHIILDRSLGGPDASFSMEPKEFEEMVTKIRNTEKALGNIGYFVQEKDKARRRSIFAVKDICIDELFSFENIKSLRPGYGLHPKFMMSIIGKKAKKYFAKGDPIFL
jgi:pseudaminic acid synthase